MKKARGRALTQYMVLVVLVPNSIVEMKKARGRALAHYKRWRMPTMKDKSRLLQIHFNRHLEIGEFPEPVLSDDDLCAQSMLMKM